MQSLRIVDDVPYAILVDMHDIRSLAKSARDAFATDGNVLAAAMLGAGPMDRVLAASSEQALHPAQFFDAEHEAIAWLRRHLVVAPQSADEP